MDSKLLLLHIAGRPDLVFSTVWALLPIIAGTALLIKQTFEADAGPLLGGEYKADGLERPAPSRLLH